MKNDDTPVLTSAALYERVQKKTGVDVKDVKETAVQLFAVLEREIKQSESIKLQGFGTFKKVYVAEAEGRNPAADKTIEIPAHYKVKFIPAPALAEKINKPYSRLKPKILKEEVIPTSTVPMPIVENQEQPVLAESLEPVLTDAAPAPQEAPAEQSAQDTPAEQEPAAVQETVQHAETPVSAEPAVQETAVAEKAGTVPAEPSAQTVENQTVQHAVIEHQVIQQQIVQQQVIQQTAAPRSVNPQLSDDEYDADYDSDDGSEDMQRYISRCWFFAGMAVVLTAVVIVTLVYMLMHATPKSGDSTAQRVSGNRQTEQTAPAPVPLLIAADDNLYAGIAKAQYGSRSLWPYIFSANMLRYPDPDSPGPAKALTIPPKPDKAIDRKDIELSVMDVYDAYRILIDKRPKGKTADIRREHASQALVCGETLYPGFIDTYAIRCDADDVKQAREMLRKAGKR
jgi:DNA-binding protein HU-beta